MLTQGLKYGSCAECMWGERYGDYVHFDCTNPKRRGGFSAGNEEVIAGVDYIFTADMREMYEEGLETCGPMHALFKRRRRRHAA